MKSHISQLACCLLICFALVQCKKDDVSKPGVAAENTNTSDTSVSLQGGRISLEIPAGAMPEGTSISIGNSDAEFIDTAMLLHQFQLLPEGTKFKKPVKLVLHYDSAWMEGNSPFNIGVAFRYDKDGKWYAPINGEVDTVKHTISVPITHFSHWSIYTCFHLRMEYGEQTSTDNARTITMPTGKTASLHCYMDAPPATTKKEDVDDGDLALIAPLIIDPVTKDDAIDKSDCRDCDLIAPLPSPDPEDDSKGALQPDSWYVNGVSNGNSSTGTLTGMGKSFTYHAPGKVPGQNPVSITAGIQTVSHGKIYLVQDVNVTGIKWQLDVNWNAEYIGNGSDGVHIQESVSNTLFFHLDQQNKLVYDKETHTVYKINYVHVPGGSMTATTTAYRNMRLTGGSFDPKTNAMVCNLKTEIVDGTWTATFCDPSGCQTSTLDRPLITDPPFERPLSLKAQSPYIYNSDTTFSDAGGILQTGTTYTLKNIQ